MRSWNRSLCAALLASALWLAAGAAYAHPFHTSNAEMEFNPRTGRYEVSLRVLASDLEEALTRQSLSNSLGKKAQGANEKTNSAFSNEPHAAQHAAKAVAKSRINLETSPGVDRQIVAYLESRILLRLYSKLEPKEELPSSEFESDKTRAHVKSAVSKHETQAVKGSSGTFHWVGKELDKSWAWLYFELEPPPSGGAVMLTNTVFLDLNPGQINICTLSVRGSKTSLRTDARSPAVQLPPQTHSP